MQYIISASLSSARACRYRRPTFGFVSVKRLSKTGILRMASGGVLTLVHRPMCRFLSRTPLHKWAVPKKVSDVQPPGDEGPVLLLLWSSVLHVTCCSAGKATPDHTLLITPCHWVVSGTFPQTFPQAVDNISALTKKNTRILLTDLASYGTIFPHETFFVVLVPPETRFGVTTPVKSQKGAIMTGKSRLLTPACDDAGEDTPAHLCSPEKSFGCTATW